MSILVKGPNAEIIEILRERIATHPGEASKLEFLITHLVRLHLSAKLQASENSLTPADPEEVEFFNAEQIWLTTIVKADKGVVVNYTLS